MWSILVGWKAWCMLEKGDLSSPSFPQHARDENTLGMDFPNKRISSQLLDNSMIPREERWFYDLILTMEGHSAFD